MTRLIPEGASSADTQLFEEKLDSVADLASRSRDHGNGVLAGFTYWGQFIAHDIGPRPPMIADRSWALDLDSLYGSPPGQVPTAPMVEGGKFDLGTTSTGRRLDLLRTGTGKARIPDARNDENLIIAQFHLLLQRFHNAIYVRATGTQSERFYAARAAVLAIFLDLTETEYLQRVCSGSILTRLHKTNPVFDPVGWTSLPVEFVDGVMRFGHSMVRPKYQINVDNNQVSMAQIFAATGSGDILVPSPSGGPALPDDFVVDWSFFFGTRQRAASGKRIDLSIVESMRQIPDGRGSVFDIAAKNLEAGIKSRVPSGQRVAGFVLDNWEDAADAGISDVLDAPSEAKARLQAAGVWDQTPLWTFVLAEAAFERKGLRLGPLGSLVLGDVLTSAIQKAQATITAAGLAISLDEAYESVGEEVFDMADLISFVDASGE